MIRFKRNLDTVKGFMNEGTVTNAFIYSVEEKYISKGFAERIDLGVKEEKADLETKELKAAIETKEQEVVTKRGRKPKE